MSHRGWVVALLLLVPTRGFAQDPAAAQSVEGVWKIAEVVTTGADAATNNTPQPSLVIFAMGHYSYISIGGTTPRETLPAAADPEQLTDAEKIARYEHWGPVTANAGTYEVQGTTIVRHPSVAKNQAFMTPETSVSQEFELAGDTLWLISRSAADQPASETRVKLVRVR